MQVKIIKHIFLFLVITIPVLFLATGAGALEFDFSGQLSGWTMETHAGGKWYNGTGLRYIPQLNLEQPVGEESFIDLEISLNGFLATKDNDTDKNYDLDLYRAKLRYATAQSETRIGLQKINFGPARLLRSLRWFDRIDPTDPLQLTEGVYALRYKYDAANNSSAWLWGLYGNKNPKGYELFPTVLDNPEFGGRLQYPFLDGEIAGTFHTRRVDASDLHIKDFTENRFALDGQWDIGIGIWFEAVFQKQHTDIFPYDWTRQITVGADYTFGVGN